MPSIPSGIMKMKTIAPSDDKKEPKFCDATAVSAQTSIGLEIIGMAAVSTAAPVTSQCIPRGVGCTIASTTPPASTPANMSRTEGVMTSSAFPMPGRLLMAAAAWCIAVCETGTPWTRMPPPTMNIAAVPAADNVFIKYGATRNKPFPTACMRPLQA